VLGLTVAVAGVVVTSGPALSLKSLAEVQVFAGMLFEAVASCTAVSAWVDSLVDEPSAKVSVPTLLIGAAPEGAAPEGAAPEGAAPDGGVLLGPSAVKACATAFITSLSVCVAASGAGFSGALAVGPLLAIDSDALDFVVCSASGAEPPTSRLGFVAELSITSATDFGAVASGTPELALEFKASAVRSSFCAGVDALLGASDLATLLASAVALPLSVRAI
jgi:hypothetical protein